MGWWRRNNLASTTRGGAPRLAPAAVAVVVLIATVLAGCDDRGASTTPAVGAPAAQPEPEPVIAASEFDLSTPQSALAAFVKARYELRNLGATKAILFTDGDPLAVDQLAAEFAFCRVAAARFGPEALNFPDRYLVSRDDYLVAARDGNVRVEGDAATVSHARWPVPIKLRRREGGWRLDLSPAPDDTFPAPTRDAIRGAWTGIWRELTDEVSAGKHKDLEEVGRACGSKMGRITQATIGAH